MVAGRYGGRDKSWLLASFYFAVWCQYFPLVKPIKKPEAKEPGESGSLAYENRADQIWAHADPKGNTQLIGTDIIIIVVVTIF